MSITPPVVSLPAVTPPFPSAISQFRTTAYRAGTLTRRPSASLPDLNAMQSSPVEIVQCSISTSVQDSGSMPSLFGPFGLSTVTPRIVTLRQSTGWMFHIGESLTVMPSSRTFSQRLNCSRFGRR